MIVSETVYVPAAPEQESVEVPEMPSVTLAGVNVHVKPVTGEMAADRFTVPVKPFTAVTVIVAVPLEPATNATVVAVRFGKRTKNARSASVPMRPNHAVPGKSTPAESNGDAQPIIPSGGSAVRRNIAVIAKGRAVRFCVNRSAAGIARSAEAPRQMKIPSMMLARGPQNVLAPGISGQLAPM